MLYILLLGVLACILSYIGVAWVHHWAQQRHILDIPNDRSSHAQPTPRGGGLAIVVVTLSGLLVAWVFGLVGSASVFLAYSIAAILIAAVSWWDDLHPLSNRVRFTVHSLGAVLVILGVGSWQTVSIPCVGLLHLGVLGPPLTFLWIVGLTNAYNFMDGIDGIAGGQAVVAGTGWALCGWLSGQPFIAVAGVLLAASSVGFLCHNWPPAHIFMGDVGSAFLGYTFALLPVLAAHQDARLVVVGILFVWPFVFDTIFTFCRRCYRGENVFAAHRSHLYQRLVIVGYSHRFVTQLYIGLAAVGFLLAILSLRLSARAIWIVVVGLIAAAGGLWFFVYRQEYRRALPLEFVISPPDTV